MSSTEKPLNALLSLNTCCLLYLLFRWWRLLRIGHSFILAARRLRSERSGDSDCCLSSIIRSVAWRRLSKQKGTGNYGCHIAGFLLGLSQSGKPRASVVDLNQIQTAVDHACRFHGPVASARKQGGRLEIDGLRSLRLLRPGRVRSERRRAHLVRLQSRAVSPDPVRSGSGPASVRRPGV